MFALAAASRSLKYLIILSTYFINPVQSLKIDLEKRFSDISPHLLLLATTGLPYILKKKKHAIFAAKGHVVKEEIGGAAVDGGAKAKAKAKGPEVDGLPKEELSFDQGLLRMRPGKIGKVGMLDT